MYDKKQLYELLTPLPPEGLLAQDIAKFAQHSTETYPLRQLQALKARDAAYADTPSPVLSYNLFRLYKETGDRMRFQAPYYARRERLLTWALLCLYEPDNETHLSHLEDIIWDICAEPFWCLPAHFTGPFDTYEGELDLFACETGYALTEVLALHAARLDNNVRLQAEKQIWERILNPFLNPKRFFRFEHMDNNWNAVCAGAIGATALHLVTDHAVLCSLIHRALSSIQVYLNSFGEDGICAEGVGYWTYGFGFFTCFADLLARRSNGTLDLFTCPKVRAIAGSQQYFYISENRTIAFSDGAQTQSFRPGISTYLQKRFPEAILPAPEYASGVLDDNCHRFCLSLRDLIWYDPSLQYGISTECARFFPEAQWFISRRNQTGVAAKAGHNDEPHNHNDCGSFIYFKNGVPLLDDLGAGLYNAAYFGPERYSIFVNSSDSHNVAQIQGISQSVGRAFSACKTEASFEMDRASYSTQLRECYACPELQSYQRHIVHEASTVTVNDSFRFSVPGMVTETFISRHPITLGDGCALLEDQGVQARLYFDSALFTPCVLTQEYEDHVAHKQTAWLLHLECREAALHIECVVRIE